MSARLKVLIVDDDRDLAGTIEDIVAGRGHEVTVAFDGESAVRLFREQAFDLCFMDVKLPGANGVDSLQQIRRLHPAAKVVMMTAYSVEDLLGRAVSLGAVAVLHKPLHVREILRQIEKVGPRGVVLVVEDDDDFAVSLEEALAEAGYKTLRASDGDGALAEIERRPVDVMVLDLRLPARSGLEVFQELRRRGRAVPTVVVTGYPREEAAAVEALQVQQVASVLVKPIDLAALLRIVDEACAAAGR